jgi:uncharacterized protein YgiM (DUF1202 family)
VSMRSALRLLPLMAIGALAAFLLAGPLTSLYKTHAVASRPQPTPLATVTKTTPTPCPASLPTPAQNSTTTAATPTLPTSTWVNAPLGVNFRDAPSTSGKLLTTLAQGTQGTADSKVQDASGNVWYHLTVGSQTGWSRADFISTIPIHPVSGTGWSLMLPQADSLIAGDSGVTTFGVTSDALPFLTVQTSTASTLTVQLPAVVRSDLAPVGDRAKTIEIWNYTVTEHTTRVALDTCRVTSASTRADQGWPYVTSVFVHTQSRNYLFAVYAATSNNPLVDQVLSSIALS